MPLSLYTGSIRTGRKDEAVVGSTVAARQNASTFRTRRKIHDAFMALAQTRDVARITVSDVTAEAGLNRTTFYLHYPDIETLLDAVIDELMHRLQEGARTLLARDRTADGEWRETFYHTMAAQPRLFISLLRSTARDMLVSRLMHEHETFFLAQWEKDEVSVPEGWPDLQTCATFAAGGVHALTVNWLVAGMPQTPEEIGNKAFRLGMAVVRQIDTEDLPIHQSVAET